MAPQEFERVLGTLPQGYSDGSFSGRRYGLTLRRSEDGRRITVFARELSGKDVVSFNFYKTKGGRGILKPCEMSSQKVTEFVIGFMLRSGLPLSKSR